MNSYLTGDVTLPTPQRRNRGNRMMVVLLAVITGLLLVLGVMGWWFLAGINARYSRVVAETATSLNQLHEVRLHSFTGYGNFVELRATEDPKAREALLKTMMEQRALNDRVFENLQHSLTDPQESKCLQDVLAKRQICRKEANEMLAANGSSAPTVPNTEASLKFLQNCIMYQQACNQLTDQIEKGSLHASQEMAVEIKNLRWVFLGIGVLPIVAAAVFLVLLLGVLQVINIHAVED